MEQKSTKKEKMPLPARVERLITKKVIAIAVIEVSGSLAITFDGFIENIYDFFGFYSALI
ncbi:MAG: hypothetical protein F6K06_17600 [Okeania sp. SIO1H4]|uniref:hypothetical protein n=1 Tax=Okeania sp. SIO1H5 TaxID=2607777 RepID=UPI0013B6ACAB|nr:hypothetical protein [Okeania sp. SIO1H5]NEP04144.1 hypothetical protein [Okeania sp. SIO4D6]NEP95482.1 hypothetical protein [Okeania sp. SIO2F5]NEQ91235.1 hypothetical protein [Okeania sp. SIO2G4]NES77497.1 hypothetical protein [Okeania sp. SIO1H4]